MQNETILQSETIKSDTAIHTVILTKHNKNDEWFRHIKSTDKDWDGRELGFDNYEAAVKRYNADVKSLTRIARGEENPKLNHAQATARLELGDKVYQLAEACGLDDDWVMQTVKGIEAEVQEITGLDLSEA